MTLNYWAVHSIIYQYDLDKEVVRAKTAKLFYASKTSYSFKKLGDKLNERSAFPDTKIDSLNDLINLTHQELEILSETLMKITGGRNDNGEFMHPVSKSTISKYFFTTAQENTEGTQKFNKFMTDYLNQYGAITGGKSELFELFQIYDINYQRSLVRVFLGTTLSEALYTIEAMQNRIEVDRYKFLIQ